MRENMIKIYCMEKVNHEKDFQYPGSFCQQLIMLDREMR